MRDCFRTLGDWMLWISWTFIVWCDDVHWRASRPKWNKCLFYSLTPTKSTACLHVSGWYFCCSHMTLLYQCSLPVCLFWQWIMTNNLYHDVLTIAAQYSILKGKVSSSHSVICVCLNFNPFEPSKSSLLTVISDKYFILSFFLSRCHEAD